MGIEYVEYRIKIKNKKTNEEKIVCSKEGHKPGTPLYKKEDFEILGLVVAYG